MKHFRFFNCHPVHRKDMKNCSDECKHNISFLLDNKILPINSFKLFNTKNTLNSSVGYVVLFRHYIIISLKISYNGKSLGTFWVNHTQEYHTKIKTTLVSITIMLETFQLSERPDQKTQEGTVECQKE